MEPRVSLPLDPSGAFNAQYGLIAHSAAQKEKSRECSFTFCVKICVKTLEPESGHTPTKPETKVEATTHGALEEAPSLVGGVPQEDAELELSGPYSGVLDGASAGGCG